MPVGAWCTEWRNNRDDLNGRLQSAPFIVFAPRYF
jgi:hypothetical protein